MAGLDLISSCHKCKKTCNQRYLFYTGAVSLKRGDGKHCLIRSPRDVYLHVTGQTVSVNRHTSSELVSKRGHSLAGRTCAVLSRCTSKHFARVSSRAKHALMPKQQGRRLLGQQLPWQVSVGAAFALTVICCAKQGRRRARQRTGATAQAVASAAEQVLFYSLLCPSSPQFGDACLCQDSVSHPLRISQTVIASAGCWQVDAR